MYFRVTRITKIKMLLQKEEMTKDRRDQMIKWICQINHSMKNE